MLPWKYNSSVIIQTKEDNGSVQIFGRTQARHEKPAPQFTETQFQIIQLLFLLICFYPVILCAQLVEQNTNRSVVANAYSGLEFNSANTLVIAPD